jgi:hypothetical protein
MESTIENAVNQDEWAVVSYKWSDEAIGGPTILGPLRALGARHNAVILGKKLGKTIADLDLDRVHLIGHSAGSALINEIAQQLANATNRPELIHTTFLDAFALPLVDNYGAYSDWSDHYVNTSDYFAFQTDEILANAYNVDVTNLLDTRPSPTVGHQWPRIFYQQTILGIADGSQGTGFPLSYEAGNRIWDLTNGEVITLGEGEPSFFPPALGQWSDEQILQTWQDLGYAISPAGTVDLVGDLLTMRTGSPVWVTGPAMFAPSFDAVRFDVEFTSEAGAEGLLAVYFDDVPLGTIDERFALGSMDQYVLPLPEHEAGLHTLSFRLDSFSEIDSSIALSNVQFGSFVPSVLSGDYDRDGDADGADFLQWQRDSGSSVEPYAGADGDGSGFVDGADFLIWHDNFGATLLESPPTTVPEPSLPLLMVGGAMPLFHRRRLASQDSICQYSKHGAGTRQAKSTLRFLL